jgi:regulator of nucleoside diphosphate kinase
MHRHDASNERSFIMHNAIQERPPPIMVSETEYDRLTGLAEAALERLPDAAQNLLTEMDRATVAKAAAMPSDVVRMGSTVSLRGGDGPQRVTLVYPGEADIAAGKISVLTPLGAALIGVRAGQSIRWVSRDGRELALDVVAVEPPVEQGRPS